MAPLMIPRIRIVAMLLAAPAHAGAVTETAPGTATHWKRIDFTAPYDEWKAPEPVLTRPHEGRRPGEVDNQGSHTTALRYGREMAGRTVRIGITDGCDTANCGDMTINGRSVGRGENGVTRWFEATANSRGIVWVRTKLTAAAAAIYGRQDGAGFVRASGVCR